MRLSLPSSGCHPQPTAAESLRPALVISTYEPESIPSPNEYALVPLFAHVYRT